MVIIKLVSYLALHLNVDLQHNYVFHLQLVMFNCRAYVRKTRIPVRRLTFCFICKKIVQSIHSPQSGKPLLKEYCLKNGDT